MIPFNSDHRFPRSPFGQMDSLTFPGRSRVRQSSALHDRSECSAAMSSSCSIVGVVLLLGRDATISHRLAPRTPSPTLIARTRSGGGLRSGISFCGWISSLHCRGQDDQRPRRSGVMCERHKTREHFTSPPKSQSFFDRLGVYTPLPSSGAMTEGQANRSGTRDALILCQGNLETGTNPPEHRERPFVHLPLE
jgi:hypothetical protein